MIRSGGWVAAVVLALFPAKPDRTILVSAAASLTDAMKEIGTAFGTRYPGVQVRFNFGASGTLAQQIRQGAPVDVFASAGEKEMDELAKARDLAPKTRKDFASNRLALIAPIGSKIRGWADLASPSVRRIALPKPELVPSGRYGKETLEHRRLWNGVQGKLIYANNVRQALAYVAGGDVDCGIVFVTDAQVEKERVRVVALAKPRADHEPIFYPVAAISRSQDPNNAASFAAFLLTKPAQSILKSRGFAPVR
jgi:molybdate transport system substrate-binding protein